MPAGAPDGRKHGPEGTGRRGGSHERHDAMNGTRTGPLQAWIGRRETRADRITAAPLAGLAATLDRDADGHPKRGEFLPPVALPRRMWAGGRLEFLQPLFDGEPMTVCGRATAAGCFDLWACGPDGSVAMRAEAKAG